MAKNRDAVARAAQADVGIRRRPQIGICVRHDGAHDFEPKRYSVATLYERRQSHEKSHYVSAVIDRRYKCGLWWPSSRANGRRRCSKANLRRLASPAKKRVVVQAADVFIGSSNAIRARSLYQSLHQTVETEKVVGERWMRLDLRNGTGPAGAAPRGTARLLSRIYGWKMNWHYSGQKVLPFIRCE